MDAVTDGLHADHAEQPRNEYDDSDFEEHVVSGNPEGATARCSRDRPRPQRPKGADPTLAISCLGTVAGEG